MFFSHRGKSKCRVCSGKVRGARGIDCSQQKRLGQCLFRKLELSTAIEVKKKKKSDPNLYILCRKMVKYLLYFFSWQIFWLVIVGHDSVPMNEHNTRTLTSKQLHGFQPPFICSVLYFFFLVKMPLRRFESASIRYLDSRLFDIYCSCSKPPRISIS